MNGQTFQNLLDLEGVGLSGNQCINQQFNSTSLALMQGIVSDRCGFDDFVGHAFVNEKFDEIFERLDEILSKIKDLTEQKSDKVSTDHSVAGIIMAQKKICIEISNLKIVITQTYDHLNESLDHVRKTIDLHHKEVIIIQNNQNLVIENLKEVVSKVIKNPIN